MRHAAILFGLSLMPRLRSRAALRASLDCISRMSKTPLLPGAFSPAAQRTGAQLQAAVSVPGNARRPRPSPSGSWNEPRPRPAARRRGPRGREPAAIDSAGLGRSEVPRTGALVPDGDRADPRTRQGCRRDRAGIDMSAGHGMDQGELLTAISSLIALRWAYSSRERRLERRRP